MTSTVYISNVDCEAIRARIALKLGGLLSFMIRNAFLYKNQHVWEKLPIEGAIHLRSHSIPLNATIKLFRYVYGGHPRHGRHLVKEKSEFGK